MRRILTAAVLIAFAMVVGCSAPNADALSLKLVPVVRGLTSPVYVTSVRGGSGLYIVQQNGVIRIFRNGRLLSTPFLDLRGRVSYGGEQGLLSMALDPHFLTESPAVRLLHEPGRRQPRGRLPHLRQQP